MSSTGGVTSKSAEVYQGFSKEGAILALPISCDRLKSLNNSRRQYIVTVLYVNNGNGQWNQCGKTDVIPFSSSPTFTKKLRFKYTFETPQKLIFYVYSTEANGNFVHFSENEVIGSYECMASDIVKCNGFITGMVKKNGTEMGVMKIGNEELPSADISLRLSTQGLELPAFLRLSTMNEWSKEVPVYKTDVSETGVFSIVSDSQQLCNGDTTREMVIRAFKYISENNEREQGTARMTIKKLLVPETSKCDFINQQTNRSVGSMKVDTSKSTQKSTFVNYIKTGLAMRVMIAIDVTASNHSCTSSGSLHFFDMNRYNRQEYNPYEQGMLSIAGVIEAYSANKPVQMYGFGADDPGLRAKKLCFPFNIQSGQADVYGGMNGVMDVYHSTIPKLDFGCDSVFRGVLSKAREVCSSMKQSRGEYMVLLIFTDGQMGDVDESIQWVCENSDLPISIIVVGVGNSNFSGMHKLNGGKNNLKHNGKSPCRNIMQFLAMNTVSNKTPQQIASSLLEVIPQQLVEYMNM